MFLCCSQMNDLPVIGYLCYAQRSLGSPGGKHCWSLEGNVWRKAVSTSKKRMLERDQHFFAVVLSLMDLGMLICVKCKFLSE